MPNVCVTNSTRRQLSQPYQLARRCFNNISRIRIKSPHNLPENDSLKTLSNRDKKFFLEVKKIRSSLYPPVLTKGRRSFYLGTIATVTSDEEIDTTPQQPQPLLPQFHASAFLDPKYYCRVSAEPNSTISGSDAVRRLIRGKRNLLETMRKETHECNNNKEKEKRNQKLYVLRDHGVPVQLFQHLLKSSNTWLLQQINSSRLSIKNTSGNINFDHMLIQTKDGSSTVRSWPKKWRNDMEIYLTVMNRIAASLSDILQPMDGLSKPQIVQWNVNIHQQDVNMSKMIPLSSSEEGKDYFVNNDPIVEFSILKKDMGQIAIHLKSSSDSATDGEESSNMISSTSMTFVGVFNTTLEE